MNEKERGAWAWCTTEVEQDSMFQMTTERWVVLKEGISAADAELKRLRGAVEWAIAEMEDVAPDYFGSVWKHKASKLRRRAGIEQ